MSAVALHLAPHPDDELVGAPATLMALRDAGWRVVNLACGLGGEEGRRAEREAELREACARAGFELLVAAPGAAADERALAVAVSEAITSLRPAIVVSPGPRDRHPAHERVAAAARRALEAGGRGAPRWWQWALWGYLERPSLAVGFGSERLREILAALGAHRGELARNDLRRLLRGRAEANAILAPELLFGFGSAAASGPPYAELLSELVRTDGAWRLGRPRLLDPAEPLAAPGGEDGSALANPAGAGQGDA